MRLASFLLFCLVSVCPCQPFRSSSLADHQHASVVNTVQVDQSNDRPLDNCADSPLKSLTMLLLELHQAGAFTPCIPVSVPIPRRRKTLLGRRTRSQSMNADESLATTISGTSPKSTKATSSESAKPPSAFVDWIDKFCRGTNDLMAKTVFPQIRERVSIREATPLSETSPWQRLVSPPEVPGIPRPVWLVIAASLPTALGWYGYYKFSVEEELFQDEIRRSGRATGCGGYGTLFPFVWCILIGGLGQFVFHVDGSDKIIEAGSLWILLGQVNLYRRVNELFEERGEEPPVYAWWALLPPPLDVVVGLRQVHFLARYWSDVRGEECAGDDVAERYFPFISSPRFTLKEFVRNPSIWFWFTRDWDPFWGQESKDPPN